jgi:phage terminase small subunit
MAKYRDTKRQKFVREYMVDLNATQAAIRAGYSPKTAGAIGNENLKKLEIEILTALAERSARTGVSADRVIRELARVAFADPRSVFSWGPGGVTLRPSDELTEDEAAIVSEVSETRSENGGSIKAKCYDKVKALELLGRHLGMFSEKREIELSGSVGVNVFDPETRATLIEGLNDPEESFRKGGSGL